MICWALQSSISQSVLEVLLGRTAEYLAIYQTEIGVVVSEEQYVQRQVPDALGARVRRLRSDVAVLNQSVAGWIVYRDVYEVDGKLIRGHDDRVTSLFSNPNSTSLETAKRVTQESARYNLDGPGVQIGRTINTPFSALRFLLRENQPRSEFTLAGNRTIDGHKTLIIRFKERGKPRIIGTIDDAPAIGEFAVDPAAGSVRWTELTIETSNGSASTVATVRVTYADDSKSKLILPKSMDDQYETRIGDQVYGIKGTATYSNYRQFKISVSGGG